MRVITVAAAFFVICSVGRGGELPDSSADAQAPASPAVLAAFLSSHQGMEFLTFPEIREHPIRLFDAIPEAWTKRTEAGIKELVTDARPGEHFVFQIGVYAHKGGLNNVRVQWTGFRGSASAPPLPLTCYNTEGTDYSGKPLRKKISVDSGRVQPLWFGTEIPSGARGTYETQITIAPANTRPLTVRITLHVAGAPAVNHGLDHGKNLSRLSWLNSTLGMDASVTRGFQPVRRTGLKLQILGRTVELDTLGLPGQVVTFFEPSNQFLREDGRAMLTAPVQFVVQRTNGISVTFVPDKVSFTEETPGRVQWEVCCTAPECDLALSGSLDYDGFMEYHLTLTAKHPLHIRDIRLVVPLARERVPYMMGLNHEGGERPASWDWRWDTAKNQDMLWLGGVNGGMRFTWKAENYVRPLINLYYEYGPLHMPPSWGNGGKGGVKVSESGANVLLTAFSGPREMAKGEMLHFDHDLLLTPTKLVDRDIRWRDRYFHGGGTVARSKVHMADSVGANIINIHHAEDLYPFINYPYLDENVLALKELVADAHKNGKRLKLYYTTRELTKNLPEFWAMFSLNGEIIFPGPGSACTTIINPNGPNEWLRKNLKERYIPAWLNVIKEGPFKGELDLAVLTTPDSRLNNYYIGGLDWMLGHLGIDGIYVDDSALDRLTMRRARKLIDHDRPQGRIDFHSWNHFNAMAGFTNCLNLYMDLLPYIDLVWIGEGRDYDRLPDHWLIEVSGIPFGLTGQMLNNAGNPWRGMVYGITNRPGWAGNPSALWKFWDEVHIDSTLMVGYWDAECPVKTDNPLVKATVYKGSKRSIIAVAAWGKDDLTTSLSVDWAKLGYRSTRFRIPGIDGFQEARVLNSLQKITIPAGKGNLIVLDRK